MHQEASSSAESAGFRRFNWKSCGYGTRLAAGRLGQGAEAADLGTLEERTIDRRRYERVKELFGRALERPPAEREFFLAQACTGEDSLREEVLELLRFQTDPSERLQAPVQPLASLDETPDELRLDPLADSPTRCASEYPDSEGEEPDQLLPKSLGDFEIRELLGRGGMGVVYHALQREPRREVALKVLRPGTLSPQIRARFAREAEALRRLEHPGIARFLEAGTFETPLGQQPYFAMEYVKGFSLREYIRQRKLDDRERLELLAAICDAVHHAHEHGIVHRDLKPENILVDRHGQPRILDFGLARPQDSNIQVTSFMTGIGQLIGTIQYMSPEQARASPEAVKASSDIYSLGVLGQELLTGRLPYELPNDNIPGAIVTIVTAEPVLAGDVQPTLRGDVELILTKALEKDPADRYVSCAAMAADIRRYLNRERISIPRPGPGRRVLRFSRRHRRLTRTVLLSGAIATLVPVLLIRSPTRWTPEQIESELQVVYGLFMNASDNLHVSMQMNGIDIELPQKRQEIQASIADLMQARTMLTRIPTQPFSSDLRTVTAWSLGEAHYFLGRLDHDPDLLEMAGAFFRESASFRPSRPRFVAGMDTSLAIFSKIGLMLPHHSIGGEGFSAMALSRYRAPAYWLQRAATARGQSWASFIGYRDSIPHAYTRVLTGYFQNEIGDNAASLGAVLDSLPLIHKGIVLLQKEALENNLSTVWGARGSFLHNYGVAFLRRGELTGSQTDLDSARSWLNTALTYRKVGLDYLEFIETQRRLAQVDLAAARLAATTEERRIQLESSLVHLGEVRQAQKPDTHPVEIALTDLLEAEVRIDLGDMERSSTQLSRVDSLLDRIAPLLPAARYAVQNGELRRQRGRLHTIRWAMGHHEADRRLAFSELNAALEVLDRAQCPHFHRLVLDELATVAGPEPSERDTGVFGQGNRRAVSLSAPELRVTRGALSPERTGVLRSDPSTLPSDLLGWWPADGTFEDAAAERHGISAGGVVFTAGKVGRAFLFDGSTRSYILIRNDPALHPKGNRLTIAAWIKPDFRAANSFDTILSKRDLCDESRATYCLYVVKAPSDVRVGSIMMILGQPAAGSAVGLSTRPVPDDGEFHHVAGTYDGSMIRLYLDGAPVGSARRTGSLPRTDSAPVISHPGGLCETNSRAVIDEVMFFGRALTEAEIARLIAASYAEGVPSGAPAPERLP